MQVASRILLVWAIVDQFPFLAKSAVYSSMLIAWSVTEVIRYSYFVFNLSGFSPSFMTWLRYNTFFVLYPLGISSECWLIYKAIEPARAIRPELAWVLQSILVLYVPGMCRKPARSSKANESRCLYLVYAHDDAKKKGFKRKEGTKDSMNSYWQGAKNGDTMSLSGPALSLVL